MLQLLPHGRLLLCGAGMACAALGALPNPTRAWCSPANLISYCSVFLLDFGTAELHFAKDLPKTAAVGGGEALTSDIQSIVTGELCKGWHVRGVIGQLVGLLSNAPCSLLDALVVGVLNSWGKVYSYSETYRSCADPCQVWRSLTARALIITFPCKQSLPHSLGFVNWVTTVDLHKGWPDLKSPPAGSRLGFGGFPEFRNCEE